MFPSRIASVLGGGTGFQNNYSLEFDGSNDGVLISDNSSIDLGTGDFTISVWAKVADWTSQKLLYKQQDSSNRWYMSATSGDTLYFFSKAGGVQQITYEGTLGALTAHQNKWVHLVIVADRSDSIKGYINATLDDSDSGDTTDIDNSGDLGIGYDGTSGGGIAGNLDEVSIWNKVLSTGDISALYSARGTANLNDDGNSANLQGWWRFEEGSGTSAIDSSTNSNTGTLTNGPAYSADVPS